MMKFIIALFLLSLPAQAAAPVIWSGTSAKWLPSGLQSAGACTLDATGLMGSTMNLNLTTYQAATGTAATPGFYTATGSGNAGMYWDVTNGLSLGYNGTRVFSTNATNSTFLSLLGLPVGSVGAPSLYWGTDTDSGFYQIADNNIGLSLNGTNRVNFGISDTAFNGSVTSSLIYGSSSANGTLTLDPTSNGSDSSSRVLIGTSSSTNAVVVDNSGRMTIRKSTSSGLPSNSDTILEMGTANLEYAMRLPYNGNASEPGISPLEGHMYFNTDLDAPRWYSGSAWVTFAAAGNYITALTGDVTATGPGSVAATIADDAVTDAKFRESAGLSVVGRSANSTGNVADITAANDGEVLRRSGTSIGFGDIGFGALPQITSYEVYGNATGATADAASTSITSLLDGAFSSVQGSILYRGASAWLALAPGADGEVLTSGGAGANPAWEAGGGGGSGCATTGQIYFYGGNGQGSSSTTRRRFTTMNDTDDGACLTGVQSATLGDIVTVTSGCSGLIFTSYRDSRNGGNPDIGISLNNTTTAVGSLSGVEIIGSCSNDSNIQCHASGSRLVTGGNTISFATDGSADGTTNIRVGASVTFCGTGP